MSPRRAGIATAYLTTLALVFLTDIEARLSDGAAAVVLLVVTVMTAFAIGRIWAVLLVVPAVALMAAIVIFSGCDRAVSYSCDSSVDPWWPPMLFTALPMGVALATGVALSALLRPDRRHSTDSD